VTGKEAKSRAKEIGGDPCWEAGSSKNLLTRKGWSAKKETTQAVALFSLISHLSQGPNNLFLQFPEYFTFPRDSHRKGVRKETVIEPLLQ
jgi:hypothetical protein